MFEKDDICTRQFLVPYARSRAYRLNPYLVKYPFAKPATLLAPICMPRQKFLLCLI